MTLIRNAASAAALIFATISSDALAEPAPEAGTIHVLDPGRTVLGKTLGEWAGDWSEWAYRFPTDNNPILDQTGEFCDLGQKGNVWFLAGSFFSNPVQPFHRSCTIPRARYIFVPIVNGLAFAPEFPEADDPCSTLAEKVGQVRCDVNFDIVPTGVDPLPSYRQPGVTALEVRVDGKRIPDPFAYRVQSPPRGFTFHVRNGSILTEIGLTAGPRSPAVADGYWIMLAPLPPGDHRVRILAERQDESTLDVTWTLEIAQ
jgi:hypothetical protein